MKTKKVMISMILSAVLLFSEFSLPVQAAEDTNVPVTEEILENTSDTRGQNETENDAVVDDTEEEVENSDATVNDTEGMISDDLSIEPLNDDISVTDGEPVALSADSLSLSITYPSNIQCGSPVTFTMNATGGIGNYKYRIDTLMDSTLSSVYDVSYGHNGDYVDSNQFTFTFYASGTYYIRFGVMDMTTYQTKRTGLYEYPVVIQDANYPSVDQIVTNIASQCEAACTTDFEKALWLHDWIIDHADYDNSYSYCSAEGVLARGVGTCESYHRAYVMLLNKVGIQTGRIAGNGHVWTAVRMDGEWYQIDSTWDDLGAAYKDTYYEHMYFGLTDDIISLVHDDHKAAVPGYESTALENNYFIKTGEIKQWSDPFIATVRQNITAGKTEFSLPVSSSMPGNYKNVIYNLVAYQLSKENWDGVELSVSYADNKLACAVKKPDSEGGTPSEPQPETKPDVSSQPETNQNDNKGDSSNTVTVNKYKQTIADGTYKIESALGTGFLLDVNGAAKNNCANVQLWKGSQTFKVTYLGDGKYSLMATCSGKYIDAENGGRAVGTNILQYDWKGGENQKWYIQDAGNGYYYIRSAVSELCLDVYGASAKNGANVQLWNSNGGSNQKFRFVGTNETTTNISNKAEYYRTIADGTYKIESALGAGFLLDVNGAVKNNCANVQLWKGDQTFKVTYLGDGKYSLMATCSGKYIDAENGGRAAGTNILQYDWKGGENQKWYIQDAGNGYYYIRSAVSELCLDVYGASAKNGANVQLWNANGGKNQRFKFSKANVQANDINNKTGYQQTIAGGTYKIESALGTGLLLDVNGAVKDNCANVQLWKGSQTFKVTYLGDGKYSLMATCSGKYVDAEGGGRTSGTNVIQYDWNGGENQKWYIQDAGNGYYYIMSAQSGLRLDVCNSGKKNGTNVLLWSANGGSNQKFKFKKV